MANPHRQEHLFHHARHTDSAPLNYFTASTVRGSAGGDLGLAIPLISHCHEAAR